MIRIDNLEHTVGRFVLEISRTELYGGITLIVGANGAGKTTLMELLATVKLARSGAIHYLGRDPARSLPLIRSQIGYVPSEITLHENMTPRAVLLYLAELKGTAHTGAVDEILRDFRLVDCQDIRIKKLSQGVQRRLAIAQSLLARPRFLFLDEPLNGLDVDERRWLLSYLAKLAGDNLIAASAHELNEWEGIADYIIWLDGGKIRYQGNTQTWKTSLPWEVWEGEVSRTELERIPVERLIHSRLLPDGGIWIRLTGESRLFDSLHSSEPTLEDAYFIRKSYTLQRLAR
ncbi:ABC transporter ATP-binding protein [Paenibacillus tuaregi]|uniref:ABC transporter ATP-binding protein n=1 Tax=Paenibacillus tuaregi TaxID=1816681 RepID=UPI000839A178|nr:ABC transporter ATP-binding protein [Paenibacillus tuaregi]